MERRVPLPRARTNSWLRQREGSDSTLTRFPLPRTDGVLKVSQNAGMLLGSREETFSAVSIEIVNAFIS